MMDTGISTFIHERKFFSIPLLLNAFARLTVIQLNKGYLGPEDVTESVKLVASPGPSEFWNAHIALILEGAVVKVPLSANNPTLVYKVPSNIFANEEHYLRCLLEVLYRRTPGDSSLTVERFQIDAMEFLHRPASLSRAENNVHLLPVVARTFPASQERIINQKSRLPHSHNRINNISNTANTYATDLDLERSDAILRLLAQVRKNGMDLLFPQLTHDMVLVTILVSVQIAEIPIHREIIDIIVAIKDSRRFSGLENVSKTKIRGVLALLKHSELLNTEGEEGEPVRLSFPSTIHTFEELRKAHDQFLVKYMSENHVYLPGSLKPKVLWFYEEMINNGSTTSDIKERQSTVSQKVQYFHGLVQQMKDYLKLSYRSRNINDPQYASLMKGSAITGAGTTSIATVSSAAINTTSNSPNSQASPCDSASLEDDFAKLTMQLSQQQNQNQPQSVKMAMLPPGLPLNSCSTSRNETEAQLSFGSFGNTSEQKETNDLQAGIIYPKMFTEGLRGELFASKMPFMSSDKTSATTTSTTSLSSYLSAPASTRTSPSMEVTEAEAMRSMKGQNLPLPRNSRSDFPPQQYLRSSQTSRPMYPPRPGTYSASHVDGPYQQYHSKGGNNPQRFDSYGQLSTTSWAESHRQMPHGGPSTQSLNGRHYQPEDAGRLTTFQQSNQWNSYASMDDLSQHHGSALEGSIRNNRNSFPLRGNPIRPGAPFDGRLSLEGMRNHHHIHPHHGHQGAPHSFLPSHSSSQSMSLFFENPSLSASVTPSMLSSFDEKPSSSLSSSPHLHPW